MRDHLYEMRDLAYNIKAHQSILDRANAGDIQISVGKFKFHQVFVLENEPRVKEYELATETPTQMIDQKLQFLEGLRSRINPHPWCPDQTPRPALSPLIDGAASFLQEQKSRIKSEKNCLHQDISGFSDDFFSDFLESYKTIPSWSCIKFREQWACNVPPFSLKPNVDFSNQPSEVTSVLPNNRSMETIDTIAES